MYFLVIEHQGQTFFWRGKGTFTLNHDLAKKYPTWEAAEKACNRIKRWSMKFMSEEDYHNLNESNQG